MKKVEQIFAILLTTLAPNFFTMRSITKLLLSTAIAAQAVLASPIRARTPYMLKETHNPPREWTRLERANGKNIIQLQIGLKQGNFEELERHLYEGEMLPGARLLLAGRIGYAGFSVTHL